MRFNYQESAQRVLFGAGRAQELGDELARSGISGAMVIGSSRALDSLSSVLAHSTERFASRFTEVRQHVPADLVHRAISVCRAASADGLVAIGGGSAIGLAKAVAHALELPLLVIPTTYAGSEATNVYGITENRDKRTVADDRVRPATVIYDSNLTADLPVGLAGASGMNALAHAVWALAGPEESPMVTMHANQSVQRLRSGLSALAESGDTRDSREDLQLGAYLAGRLFSDSGSSVHHKICHHLGGRLGLPHAETHAALLPHTVGLMRRAWPAGFDRVAAAFAPAVPEDVLFGLVKAVIKPHDLQSHGFAVGEVGSIVNDLSANPAFATLSHADLQRCLISAVRGVPSW